MIPAVSDYESDAAAAAAIQAAYAPPPPRTNTELNVSVLQRYLPSVQAILSIAANAVVYAFDPDASSWDKSGIEGTLFVCTQSPVPGTRQPRACVFVLNRRALDNLIVDLARVSHVEISGELVMLKVDDGGWQQGDKVVGLWIHNDEDDTRQINGAMIQETWKVARSTGPLDEKQGPEAAPDAASDAGAGTKAVGKRVSMRDLFAAQHGT